MLDKTTQSLGSNLISNINGAPIILAIGIVMAGLVIAKKESQTKTENE